MEYHIDAIFVINIKCFKTNALNIIMNYEDTIISNTLTNLLANKFGLDAAATQVMSMTILKVIAIARTYNPNKIQVPSYMRKCCEKVMHNLKYFIALYVLKYLFDKRKEIRAMIKNESPTQIETQIEPIDHADLFEIDISNVIRPISVVHKFIALHPEYFETDIDYRLITIEDNPDPYRVYNKELYFDDQLHGVRGYIKTGFTTTFDNKGTKIYNYSMQLFIKKYTASKQCYISQLERYITKQTKMGKVVDLSYYKIMPQNLVTSNFYKEPVEQWAIDVQQLKDSYFCEHKDFLFAAMQNKAEGSSINTTGWNNLILHGEPGVGKSSFIYRAATLMKRSIVSIDLSLYLDKKRELYNLFYGQSFQLPSCEKQATIPEDCIIVLEEFDNSIRKLIDLERFHVLKQDLVSADFKSKQDQLLNTKYDESDTSDQPKKKINSNQVMHEIDQAVHSNTVAVKNDTLRIFDLLELFQGVISPPSRIIIATTNYYDEIRTSLPSLFRPGRLSQIKFNYMSWPLLNELSMYYFDQPMTISPIEIKIPTSQITELAVKHQLSGTHDSFQKDLMKQLTTTGPLKK